MTQGIALAEVYELYGPGLNSKLRNVSGRGFVDTGDNVLIGGFIVGDVGSGTVVVRALGPVAGCLWCKPTAQRSHSHNLRLQRICDRNKR